MICYSLILDSLFMPNEVNYFFYQGFKKNKLKNKSLTTHQTFIEKNAEGNNMFYQLTISFLSLTLRPNIRCLPINNTSMEIELSNLMVLSVKRVNYSLFNYKLKNLLRQHPIIPLKAYAISIQFLQLYDILR